MHFIITIIENGGIAGGEAFFGLIFILLLEIWDRVKPLFFPVLNEFSNTYKQTLEEDLPSESAVINKKLYFIPFFSFVLGFLTTNVVHTAYKSNYKSHIILDWSYIITDLIEKIGSHPYIIYLIILTTILYNIYAKPLYEEIVTHYLKIIGTIIILYIAGKICRQITQDVSGTQFARILDTLHHLYLWSIAHKNLIVILIGLYFITFFSRGYRVEKNTNKDKPLSSKIIIILRKGKANLNKFLFFLIIALHISVYIINEGTAFAFDNEMQIRYFNNMHNLNLLTWLNPTKLNYLYKDINQLSIKFAIIIIAGFYILFFFEVILTGIVYLKNKLKPKT